MARAPDPRVEEAHRLYDQGKKLSEIAHYFEISEGTVRSWKSRGQWGKDNATLRKSKCNVAKKKRGGQPGNKNGKGAPNGNRRAEKFGFYSAWLPSETLKIFEAIEERSPLDMLWDQIKFAYTAIIRAQQIAFVKDKDDIVKMKTKEVRGEQSDTDEWEYQYAWDRHNDFMKSQARAQAELSRMIKQYDEMLHKDWDLYTEEQKARIKLLTAKIDGDGEETEDDGFMDALNGKVDDIWRDN